MGEQLFSIRSSSLYGWKEKKEKANGAKGKTRTWPKKKDQREKITFKDGESLSGEDKQLLVQTTAADSMTKQKEPEKKMSIHTQYTPSKAKEQEASPAEGRKGRGNGRQEGRSPRSDWTGKRVDK